MQDAGWVKRSETHRTDPIGYIIYFEFSYGFFRSATRTWLC
ncbi:Uncharacterized protein dnm_044790 [Desulfonema magnum]|uniref:Uncharacterized protein n=1 Tax=Desulfonema magnum TaxID=45655 RepID=A0A975BMV8_9BACT|nr:Uncharacterized protein dnm_044790 [Desulfonema magnum]